MLQNADPNVLKAAGVIFSLLVLYLGVKVSPAIVFVLGTCIGMLLFSIYLATWVLRKDEGTNDMQEVRGSGGWRGVREGELRTLVLQFWTNDMQEGRGSGGRGEGVREGGVQDTGPVILEPRHAGGAQGRPPRLPEVGIRVGGVQGPALPPALPPFCSPCSILLC